VTYLNFLTDKFDRVKVEELEVPTEGGDLVVGQVQARQLEVGSCCHIIIQTQSKNIRPQTWATRPPSQTQAGYGTYPDCFPISRLVTDPTSLSICPYGPEVPV
jgi:hypothetical protein